LVLHGAQVTAPIRAVDAAHEAAHVPGIAGIIGKSGVEQADVERMTRWMVHDPSYVSGTYANDDVGLCVGWVSHGGSFSGRTPLWNERRDVCLIFSGEDFTATDEALQCGEREFGAESATYLTALYEAQGLNFIERLNGWFSGLLVDLRKRLAVLFNDRYGLGRVYYHETPERFYFSSEAKSLLAVMPTLRRLDPRAIAETFACGSVLQDRTLFAGISLLPGGSSWSFGSNGDICKRTYFSPQTWERQSTMGEAEFYARLKETFARILPKYLRGTNSIAMSLTGGLDGRMIMAWAKPAPGALPCYTFGGSYRECADVMLARRIAMLCGQSHRTIPIASDFLTNFPSLAEKAVFISDGTMDVTGAVELYANRIARQIAPIRLTGNYGSEILRGNVAFRSGKLTEALLDPGFAALVRTADATYQAERGGHPLSFIAFKQMPWHHYARLAVEQSQLTLRSPYLDNDLVALMYRAPSKLFSSKEPFLRLIHERNPFLAKIPTDRGLVYREAPIFGKAREFCAELTVKAEYAYDYGMPQRLAGLDHLLASLHLERLFLGRHKFYHFRVWYRDQLSHYLKDILLDLRARHRPYLQGQVLVRMVDAHTKGWQNWTREIHRVLSLELLQRQLIERW
jgi:asparagine synthase (glutamine-hydrolysing)